MIREYDNLIFNKKKTNGYLNPQKSIQCIIHNTINMCGERKDCKRTVDRNRQGDSRNNIIHGTF